jgi:hypothetical protein
MEVNAMNDSQNTKLFEVLVAFVGVLVTGILGYGQWRLGEQQNLILENQRLSAEERAINDVEVRVMSLISPHLARLRDTVTWSSIF